MPAPVTPLFDWRTATVTMVAVLGSWLSAWGIATAARVNSRTRPTPRRTVVRLAVIAVVALAASEVGHLFVAHPWWAGAALAAALGGSIWIRRFGSHARTLGSFVSLPFITVLVAPVVPMPGHAHTLWPAVVAAIALVWVTLAQAVGDLTGFARLPPATPASGPTPAPASGRRASTRLAVQMAVAVAVSFVLAHWWFPDHWVWAVLSAYVVGAGNRGRGDVLLKGAERLGGALVGTVAATLLAESFGQGERWAIVVLFVVMGLSLALRERSYPVWAAGVTAMTALLHGYYGQFGLDLMGERVVGIVLGSVLAVTVAWFVLPIRTRDVWRKRYGDARRAAAAWRDALREAPAEVPDAQAAFERAMRELALIEPTWRGHARLRRRAAADGEHPVGQLAALHDTHARLLAATERQLGQRPQSDS